jgi:steroid delta-isomerase-like uncharacterized protein
MTEGRKIRMRKAVDEMYNKGNFSSMDQIYASGVACQPTSNLELEGKDQLKAYIQDLRGAYSDFKTLVDEIIVEGNTAVARGTIEGTHTGESRILKVPPTGKYMKTPFCSVTHWKDGKIVNESTYIDLLSLLSQLGVAPVPSSEGG